MKSLINLKKESDFFYNDVGLAQSLNLNPVGPIPGKELPHADTKIM